MRPVTVLCEMSSFQGGGQFLVSAFGGWRGTFVNECIEEDGVCDSCFIVFDEVNRDFISSASRPKL
jgi:hypothetical protein